MKKISKEFWIGVVVIISIAILIVGVNYLKGINLFNKPQTYYAVYPDVGMLGESNPVLLNGFKIGLVSKIHLHPKGDGSVVVEIMLNDRNLKIPRDSELRIVSADFFGSKAIEVMIGDSAVLAINKDTLNGALEEDLVKSIKSEFEPLKEKTQKLIASVDEAVTNLNTVFASDATKGLPKTFNSLQHTMENLEKASATFQSMLSSNSGRLSEIFSNAESITTNIKNNNEKISHAIANISSMSDTLAAMQLGSTIKKVDKAMGDLSSITDKINRGEGTLGQLVTNDSLHTQLLAASKELDYLLNDMRIHPGRYLNFSLISRKEKSELSKKELQQIRDEIDKEIEEREKSGKE
ncbi:MAG: MCE family protein [Flavobacteriales bacterium]|nr:MCE family protein [Flavobacteriales bacterium]